LQIIGVRQILPKRINASCSNELCPR
jgi:hypothetical protein